VVQGTARVSSRFEDDYGIVRLRWEPGLLDPDQFAIVANLSWADADGNLNARLAVVSNTDQLAALHRACVEGTGHLGTEARVPFAIASAAKSAAKEAFTGGEAILRVFRLERLSVTLAPGETERFFRYHGRNHQISLIRGLKGSSGRIVKPCIDSMLQPWAVDRKLSIPAAIRATAPDSLPKWFFPELTSVGEPSEFSSDLEFYARDPVPEDASLEFFVNHPVRVIRVALVLEGIDTPPDPRLAPEHGSRK
jgi:hypothetical protein